MAVNVISRLKIKNGANEPIAEGPDVSAVCAVVANTTARDAILSNVKGSRYLVYRVDLPGFELWNGSSWSPVASGSGSGIAGIPMTFFASTTDGDPGAGGVRLNHATPASATSMFVDDVEAADGTNIRDLIASLANVIGAQVRLQSASAPENWIVYRVGVGGYTSATGYGKLTGLSVVDSSATVTLSTTAGDLTLSIDVVDVSTYRPVANAAARTGLPTSLRVAGMLVRENDTGALYVLAADLTTWALADTSVVNQTISHASADAVAARMTLRKARGTEASPAAVNAEDALGEFAIQGHDGSAYYDAFVYKPVAEQAGGTGKRTRVEVWQHDGNALRLLHTKYAGYFTSSADGNNNRWNFALSAGQTLLLHVSVVGKGPSNNQVFRAFLLRIRRKGSADADVRLLSDHEPLDNSDNTNWNVGYTLNTTSVDVWDNGHTAETVNWTWDVLATYI
jgi:hypothetical protein